jgi:RNA 3'-terminal phosphate cyclase (ATP)
MSAGTIEIDGSEGEGGGQVLRAALALSLHTRRPFRITQVRAKREKPGLLRQHLTAVQAATKLSNATVAGAELGSKELEFRPGPLVPGDYEFPIGSAGSTTLVLQAILPPLLVTSGRTRVRLTGGTHNPAAPPFEFLDLALAPLLRRMGAKLELELARPGFHPAGGGEITVVVDGVARLERIELLERGATRSRRALVRISNLRREIGAIELKCIEKTLGWPAQDGRIETTRNALGPGNAVLLIVECEHLHEVFTGFGERGVPAERVGAIASEAAKAWLDADAPVGMHLADQLVVPMAIAGGGTFRASHVTEHARTVVDVARKFVDVAIAIEERGADDFRFAIGGRTRG